MMIYSMKFTGVLLLTVFLFGCASGPQVVYVTDAQEVTTKALEPVSIDDKPLRIEIKKKWAAKISPDKIDAIVAMVREQISRTKRFTILRELESISVSNKNYIIEPHIDEINGPYKINIPTDPTRKIIRVTARVSLRVKSVDKYGSKIERKAFSDSRVNEMKASVKNLPLDSSSREELIYETVEVGFKAAANHLGMAFNPSFVTGKVTRVNGRTAYISIDTSKLEKMPVMKRVVEVLDDDDQNKVIAIIESLQTKEGEPRGTIIEKGGTVKEGAKVRAQVNDLQQ
jgi:hypothetical protein